jgi:hypothetical protein
MGETDIFHHDKTIESGECRRSLLSEPKRNTVAWVFVSVSRHMLYGIISFDVECNKTCATDMT